MVYSDFDLRTAIQRFGLRDDRNTDLFTDVASLKPSEQLAEWLAEFTLIAVGVNTESARSNFIITPILAEAKRRSVGPMTVMPGVALDVDRERGLSGYCDYLITRTEEFYFIQGPLIAVVEAKREDLIGGLGQCAAAMVAIRQFNETDGNPLPEVYGIVTSETSWRFLRLQNEVLTIDRSEYGIKDVGKILGILVQIVGTGIRE